MASFQMKPYKNPWHDFFAQNDMRSLRFDRYSLTTAQDTLTSGSRLDL